MITTGTKWFLGLGIVSFALAAVYGWSTGGDGLGPLSVGYKGGVGDQLGYGLLVTVALSSIFMGLVMTATRDNSARAEAEIAGTDEVPPVRPAAVSYWPVVAAFGLGLGIIGLVVEPFLFIAGAVVVGIALVEWTVQNWADHATGDPATNRRIRNRLMNPLEFPVAGALAVGLVIISFSRVFLAVSELNAVWVATALSSVILLGGAWIATRPKLGSNMVVGVLLLSAVVTLGLGVAGGLSGQRDFHDLGEEEGPVETEGELEEELEEEL